MFELLSNILLFILIVFGVYIFIVIIGVCIGMAIDIWWDNDYYE